MIVSSEKRKIFEDFTRYARFIGEKFSVEIRFDGVKAQTDGNVITLPNISGMSEDQLDFLYGILLHEVGHIRYSSFSDQDFSLLKTDLHSYIANGIEDARVENLLMKDFAGAKDIFDKLYNQYCLDESLMRKTFGVEGKDVNIFFAMAIYLHNYILKLSKKPKVEDLFSYKTSCEVLDFVKKHDIDNLVNNSPLENWEDVVNLTNVIYSLILNENKDHSKKISIGSQGREVYSQIEQANKLVEDIEKETVHIQSLNNEIKDLKNKIRQDYAAREPELSKMNKKYKSLEQDFCKKREIVKSIEKRNKLVSKISALNEKSRKAQEKINKYSEETETASEKKKEQLIDKISRQKDKFQKYSELELGLGSQLDAYENMQEDIDKYNLSELMQDCSELEASMNKLQEKIKEYKNYLSPYEEDLSNKKQKIKEIRDKIKKEANKYLKEMISSLQNKDVPINSPLSFDPLIGWDSANEFQKEWDENLSESLETIVANGMSINMSSDRDVLIEVLKAKEDLKKIDLAEIFKKDHGLSKLESVNNINSEIRGGSELTDPLLPKQTYGGPKVIPITTLHDCVKFENTSLSTPKILEFKKNNSDLIRRVKNDFKKKMSFSKKDYFKGGKEEGDLDPRNMWKLASKNDTDYFEINRPKLFNKVAASISIDISGSMDQDYTKQGENLRDLALLISEGLFECHIRHEVVGFHAPVNSKMKDTLSSTTYQRRNNNLESIVYKKFSDNHNKGLENIDLKCTDNSDGESLILIAKSLLKQPAKSRVMFIITDGKPYLSGSNESIMDSDLMNSIHWIKSKKIKIFALGFNDDPKKYYGDSYFKLDDIKSFDKFLQKMR